MSQGNLNEEELSPALRRHLDVIRACERSGEPMKRYAARKNLSIHTLYQAKKVLRKKGVLGSPSVAPAKRRIARAAEKPALRFVQAVRRSEESEIGFRWRVHLPGGVIFESNAALTSDETLRLLKSLSSEVQEGRA
jgi:hypothetical protein